MREDSSAHISVCAGSPTLLADLRAPLEQAGYPLVCHTFDSAELDSLAAGQMVIVEGTHHTSAALQLCQRFRGIGSEQFVPLLYITGDSASPARLACLESGADACLSRPLEPAELLAQVRAFLRIKSRHDRLVEKTIEVHRINKRLQSAYHQIDQELELAGRIQGSLLPQSLPELPQVRFAVHYQPCGRVGGDFYDVFRLDEGHVGLYVADAMGHGVPASLLTIYVKKGIRAKEIHGKDYRLVPPDEVLQRLNRDLIEQALSENPFITMVYVLLNVQSGQLHFARSGHPYPLYLPVEGPPRCWEVHGTLLGVFDTSYPVQSHQLRPGDKVLLYTDGIDAARFGSHPEGARSLLACAAEFRQLPIGELVGKLTVELFGERKPGDDVTLLGLEMMG